jgi:anti-sigma-K factor RskA
VASAIVGRCHALASGCPRQRRRCRATKDLELWLISPAVPAPRPLGLIAKGTLSVDLGPLAARALASGVLAVSLEPAGGSPTGSPTGPVLYQGRILATPTR